MSQGLKFQFVERGEVIRDSCNNLTFRSARIMTAIKWRNQGSRTRRVGAFHEYDLTTVIDRKWYL